MSFANNGARVKYVKNLKRAPTGVFGPSKGATAPSDGPKSPVGALFRFFTYFSHAPLLANDII